MESTNELRRDVRQIADRQIGYHVEAIMPWLVAVPGLLVLHGLQLAALGSRWRGDDAGWSLMFREDDGSAWLVGSLLALVVGVGLTAMAAVDADPRRFRWVAIVAAVRGVLLVADQRSVDVSRVADGAADPRFGFGASLLLALATVGTSTWAAASMPQLRR
ncbi:MAG: hypothetical protein AAF945_16255 [Actinomycetota bacterium]